MLELEVIAPALTEKSRVVDANVLRKGDDLYGFLINYGATETAEVSLEGLGTVNEACGLLARAILEPVIEFVPAATGTTVTLPPLSLVRVCCRKG